MIPKLQLQIATQIMIYQIQVSTTFLSYMGLIVNDIVILVTAIKTQKYKANN